MSRIVQAEELSARGTVATAKWLLGKYLSRRRDDCAVESRMITEVEAYDGERDQACHARAGRTTRTDVMYGPGGVWYVYLCYGIHEMLNLVVGPAGWPAAVLVRGVEGIRGPGRVTKQLGIDRRLNAAPAVPASGLWLEDRGVVVPRKAIEVTARIGVDYAGDVWSMKPWRFVLADSAATSKRRVERRKRGDDGREGYSAAGAPPGGV